MSVVLRFASAAVIVAIACSPGAVAAGRPEVSHAIAPPTIVSAALPPPNVPVAPLEPTVQRSKCARPIFVGLPPQQAPQPQRVLDLPLAWQSSRGVGQRVAVIDTGVGRNPRLPNLAPGGDYVSNTDGTVDCDGHGTLVAGIIAAQPSSTDGFVGVAPGATVIAIRQLSLAYEAANGGAQQPGSITGSGYGNVLTLAFAVMRAVQLGATVINISEVACAASATGVDDAALGAAVQYANLHNVVVVAAAGNVESGGQCEKQNTESGWGQVQTVASPAWFSPFVLSVASVDPDGGTSSFSLHGPWVGIAAPGRGITSLDNGPGGNGLVNRIQTDQGLEPIDGTSFASAYVAGVVALVRATFPTLTAAAVIDRVERTAHWPRAGRDDTIGYGMIDPLAALTAVLSPGSPGTTTDVAGRLPIPKPPPRADPMPREVAAIGSLTCLAVLAIGAALPMWGRRDRKPVADWLRQPPPGRPGVQAPEREPK